MDLISPAHNVVALKSDGTLCLGANGGPVGDGTSSTRTSGVCARREEVGKSAVSGMGHYVGLKQDGTLWAWTE